MNLVVDGIIFQKDSHGGIARAFRETLPRVCELTPDFQVILFTDGPLRAVLPAHPQIVHRRLPSMRPTLRPKGPARRLLFPWRRVLGRLWDRARRSWLEDVHEGIWHSTYYTLPERWTGPQVLTVHDMIPERFPEFYADPLDEIGRQRKARCIREAAVIVCDTDATRQALVSLYSLPEERLTVVHLAHSDRFRRLSDAELSSRPDDPHGSYLLYVGNRFGYKNFPRLVEAFAAWEGRETTALVCVGQAWQPEEKRLLDRFGVNGQVHLCEDVDDERLRRLYNRAAGFIYPSLDEGFGVPLLEAMACGCPVIASRIPSSLEIAGDVPIYFDPLSIEALRAALNRMSEAGTPARREAGLERAARYSWEQTALGMLEVYRMVSLVGQDRGRK